MFKFDFTTKLFADDIKNMKLSLHPIHSHFIFVCKNNYLFC